MKKIFLLLLPLFLFAQPSWYNTIATKNYELIGYGVDHDLEIARDMAKSEISKQINPTITSNININKSLKNETYNKSIKKNIATSTNVTLQGLKIIKEENKDGLWYVATIYDNRTLLQKIQEKHPNFHEKDFTNLESIKLIRKNNSWYLQIKDDNYFLNEDDFLKLFSTKKNGTDALASVYSFKTNNQNSYPTLKDGFQNQGTDALASAKYSFKTNNQKSYPTLKDEFQNQGTDALASAYSFKANKNIYNSEDPLFFEITSHKKGYISILYSEQSGKVGLIAQNQPITNKLTYPNPKSEEKLYMFNPTSKTLQELYVCIFSSKPINLKEFEAVSDNLLDESNYNFHKLLSTIKDKNYATIKLKIRGQ